MGKKISKSFNDFTSGDWLEAGGRLLEKFGSGVEKFGDSVISAFKIEDLPEPPPPPALPTILTDDTAAVEQAKKRKKSGRVSTQSAGSLSDANIYKPTLLGG